MTQCRIMLIAISPLQSWMGISRDCKKGKKKVSDVFLMDSASPIKQMQSELKIYNQILKILYISLGISFHGE